MTTEEKAKAYDKAFEKAKKKYDSKYHPGEGPSGVYLNNADLEEIFPALKESEDERIIKEIVKFIKDNTLTYTQSGCEIQKRWIDYLENQQEQKPTEWSEKDKKMMNEIITIMDGGKVTSGTYLSEYVVWLKSLPERFNPRKNSRNHTCVVQHRLKEKQQI